LVAVAEQRLLLGLHFDPTVLGTDLRWIEYFIQPLYLPESDVVLSWGDRIAPNHLGGLSHTPQYVGREDEVRRQQTIHHMRVDGLAVLERSRTLDGFYHLLNSRKWPLVPELHLYEALTATAILLDRRSDALNHIEDAIIAAALNPLEPRETLAEELGPGVWRFRGGLDEWELQLLERLKLLRSHLETNDIEACLSQLDEWQSFTVSNLKIEDLLEPTPPHGR
jgi:hypothetical protein